MSSDAERLGASLYSNRGWLQTMEDKLTPEQRKAVDDIISKVERFDRTAQPSGFSTLTIEMDHARSIAEAMKKLAPKPMSDEELAEQLVSFFVVGEQLTSLRVEAARRLRERAKAPQYTEAQIERMARALNEICKPYLSGYDKLLPQAVHKLLAAAGEP